MNKSWLTQLGKRWLGTGALLMSLAFASVVRAEAGNTEAESAEAAVELIAGFNYELVTPAQATESGSKIEVVEVFWYGCPHCYDFEPTVNAWKETLPDDVEFRRMPGVFRSSWVPHAKAYYAAEKLGMLDQIHSQLFDAIHRDNIQVMTDDDILDFVGSLNGVDADAFKKAYNSYSVKTKVKQAMKMSRAFGITGVPAVVVNGKYWSSGNVAGSYPELMRVVDALVEKERK